MLKKGNLFQVRWKTCRQLMFSCQEGMSSLWKRANELQRPCLG